MYTTIDCYQKNKSNNNNAALTHSPASSQNAKTPEVPPEKCKSPPKPISPPYYPKIRQSHLNFGSPNLFTDNIQQKSNFPNTHYAYFQISISLSNFAEFFSQILLNYQSQLALKFHLVTLHQKQNNFKLLLKNQNTVIIFFIR